MKFNTSPRTTARTTAATSEAGSAALILGCIGLLVVILLAADYHFYTSEPAFYAMYHKFIPSLDAVYIVLKNCLNGGVAIVNP